MDSVAILQRPLTNEYINAVRLFCMGFFQLSVAILEPSVSVQIASKCIESPVIIRMMDYEYKRCCKEVWYSTPFWSHHNGYKVQVKAHANGFADCKVFYICYYATTAVHNETSCDAQAHNIYNTAIVSYSYIGMLFHTCIY